MTADKQKKKEYDRKRYLMNRDKAIAYSLKWTAEHPEWRKRSKRNWELKKKYNISAEEFESLLEKQEFKCQICKSIEPGKKGFHVDHNHATGQIRGILCYRCNVAIGLVKENIETLNAMKEYLCAYN